MERNINIKIDIDDRAPTSYNDLIKVGDSINLTIDLLSKGESVDLKDSSVELFLKKEDGTKVEQEVIIGDSKVSCTPLNIQSTTVVGQVCGELVVESSGNQVTSSTFIFNVEGSTSSEILEESKDDIATIKSLQNTIVNVNSVVEKYKTNIEAIAGTSESIEALAQIKIYAESAVTEIETVVNTGNTLKTSLESENTRAENNIQELNNLGSESIKTHINNTDIHVAASDKTKWDSYEQLISDNASHLNEIANPNLLINSYFINPVNQRGKNSYNVNGGFTIDRWRLFYETKGFMTINDGYISISNDVSENTYLEYKYDIDMKFLEGKKVTFTIVYKSSATYRLNSFIASASEPVNIYLPPTDDWTVKTLTYDLSSWKYSIGKPESSIILQAYDGSSFTNGTLDVKYIKLELGDKATPFVPRLYGEELALCQRYYLRYGSGKSYLHYFNYVWENAGLAVGNIYLPVTPRQMPTINSFGKFAINHGTYTENSLFVDANQSYGNCIHISFQGSGVVGQGGYFRTNNDLTSYIEFDSEIY